ncbi:MAG: alkaline phosphatase family protein, partial [Kiritimatiellae bacterium]|nr:alkaline phosphatase family protein [Kiritimatiellia bacterium]
MRAFVFVDSLGWKLAESEGFLRDVLPYRRPLEMQFGYSCTAAPTILTGKTPAEHGHLAFYDWAPEASPFRAMRFAAPLLRPKSFWRRGRVRHQLSRLVKRLYGFTGYFQLYGIDLARLPKLDYCEKTDIFAPGGLAPVPNLADTWQAQGVRWHVSDWRKPEDENFRAASALARAGDTDRFYVYAGAFDSFHHQHPGDAAALRPA